MSHKLAVLAACAVLTSLTAWAKSDWVDVPIHFLNWDGKMSTDTVSLQSTCRDSGGHFPLPKEQTVKDGGALHLKPGLCLLTARSRDSGGSLTRTQIVRVSPEMGSIVFGFSIAFMDLQIAEDGEGAWLVRGRVKGTNPKPMIARLVAFNFDETLSTMVNADGRFVLMPRFPGRYLLLIIKDQVVIHQRTLDVDPTFNQESTMEISPTANK